MSIRTLALSLALGLVLANGAWAQQPSDRHAQAVEELFETMDMQGMLSQSIDTMLKAQVEANPQLKQFEEIMRQFLAKYMSWEYLKPGLVQAYVETFTEAELRELIAFYKTPLGKKVATTMPELMQKGAALGEKIAKDHLPELEEAISKKLQEGDPQQRP